MTFTGNIKMVGELKNFTNKQTQSVYTKRDIVLTNTESYYSRDGEQKKRENEVLFELKSDLAKNFSLQEGTKVTVNFYSKVKPYEGNYYMTNHVLNLQLA